MYRSPTTAVEASAAGAAVGIGGGVEVAVGLGAAVGAPVGMDVFWEPHASNANGMINKAAIIR